MEDKLIPEPSIVDNKTTETSQSQNQKWTEDWLGGWTEFRPAKVLPGFYMKDALAKMG